MAGRKHKHLSDEELSEFREIFNLVDLDKGGTISKEELKQLMSTLGLKPSPVFRLGRSVSGRKFVSLGFPRPDRACALPLRRS
mmetsp:Transcript_64920/g.115058  ORF Transcript_64920/g.115058 Transcript_64920/m.115058 type:complete len:83 (-) Transcript_64920:140-388(-)